MVFVKETCRQRSGATQVCRGANILLLCTLVLSTAVVHSNCNCAQHLCTVRQAVLMVHAVLSAEFKLELWSDLLAG